MGDSKFQSRNKINGPSLFFPVLLITSGVIWMFVNFGRVPVENVFRLIVYWPALLIAAGIAVILRQISWVLSNLLWLAVGAIVVWFVVFPPVNLPGYVTPELSRRELYEPLGQVKQASINLGLSVHPVEIGLSSQSDRLFFADVTYTGGLNYEVSGNNAQKSIHLSESLVGPIFNLPGLFLESRTEPWKIELTPRIPLDLNVKGGPGRVDLDLSGLQLSSFTLDGNLGSTHVRLPEDSAFFPFGLNMSAGSVNVRVPSGATFDMDVKGGPGSLRIALPKDSGVQIVVTSGGPGSFNLPEGYKKVKQGNDDDEGVWENEVFQKDGTPIRINLEISLGSITIE